MPAVLRKHTDVVAIAVVLLGYFVFSGVHSGAFCTKATGARTRLQKKIQPVHMNGRALRWMRKASALPLQLV
jgi:hypothetical protein